MTTQTIDKNDIDHNPVTPAELKEQIKFHSLTKGYLLVAGKSGGGKTTIAVTEGRELYDEVWIFNANGKSPTEVTGYGVPTEGKKGKAPVLFFSEPTDIPTVDRVGNKKILFLMDEIGNYEPEVRAALHGMTAPPSGEHRMVGSHKIGKNVVPMGTTNRRKDGAHVKRFSIPEVLRGTLVTLQPSPTDWWHWADSIGEYADTHIPAFMAFGAAVGENVGERNHFCGDPKEFNPLNPQPLPTPRGWEEVMKAIIIQSDPANRVSKSALKTYVQGRVGEPACQAAFAFLDLMGSIADVGAMKRDPEGYVIPRKKNHQFLLASAALAFGKKGLTPDEVHEETLAGTLDWVFTGLQRLDPEITTYGITSATRRGIPLDERFPTEYANLFK